MSSLYLGLMSGTSMDSIDAVLVDLGSDLPCLLAHTTSTYPAPLRATLDTALDSRRLAATESWRLDALVGEQFAHAALECLTVACVPNTAVRAIGSHGQTIFHAPDNHPPISVQLGDPNIIAQRTGITTVADFRRRDLAAGGQGAPLAPAFHRAVFSRPGIDRAVLNLGGIANISLLPGDPLEPVLGFDTGPANTLMDLWCLRHLGSDFDRDGSFAAAGEVNPALLDRLLEDPYFRRPPPKSTGREYFNLSWLEPHLDPGLKPADVQRTLCELSARSIAEALHRHGPEFMEVYVCGGGSLNPQLMDTLARALAPRTVATTEVLGIPTRAVEGAAFAWLAQQCLEGRASNLAGVTGAAGAAAILGGIYPA